MSERQQFGSVLAIALKTGHRQPMRLVDEASAEVGGGIEDVVQPSVKRGITLLSATQWQQTIDELGTDLPWTTRRANVLVECDTLAPLIGQTIYVGTIKMLVHKETVPCDLMDQQYLGLMAALVPDCRGGVHGQVVEAGQVRVGDAIVVG